VRVTAIDRGTALAGAVWLLIVVKGLESRLPAIHPLETEICGLRRPIGVFQRRLDLEYESRVILWSSRLRYWNIFQRTVDPEVTVTSIM
jgi:hypothetical protein